MNTTTKSDNQLNFYFKTTPEVSKVGSQNRVVLDIFCQMQIPLTPFEAHNIYCKSNPECPVTSIRRAITTLTKLGHLTKTNFLKTEYYGKQNYKWLAQKTF